MTRGGNARDRRRQRRSDERGAVQGAKRALDLAPQDEPLTASLTEDQPQTEMVTVEFESRHDLALRRGELTDHDLMQTGLFVADLAREKRLAALSPERRALLLAEETLADEGMAEGECACGHTAAAHEGDDHDGACTVDDCACQAFDSEGYELQDDEVLVPAVLARGLGFMDALERALAETEIPVEQAAQVTDRISFHLGGLAVDEESLPTGIRWSATIVPEGTLTDDGRAFAPGSVTWRELPLTLGAMLDTPHADVVTSSEACGRIDRIWREGTTVKAEGIFDAGEYGQKIARMVSDGTLRGISVDVAVHESEVRPQSDFFDENGGWRDVPLESDADMLDVIYGDEPPIFVVTAGVIGAVTVCPFAAFAEARIAVAASLAAAGAPNVWTVTSQHGMVAVGTAPEEASPEVVLLADAATLAPVRPNARLFQNPNLTELTALTIEDEWIYGHAAPWGVCHIAIPDVCTTAPHSLSDYECFHLKQIELDDGSRLEVGTITLGTGHANRELGQSATVAHYDHTGTAVADIVVGEDEHGIWFSGALRPGLSEERVRELRGAVLSGDWRQVQFEDGEKNLELVALLAVNVPGFPVPRARALLAAADDGTMEVVALVAAGVHAGVSDDTRLEKVKALRDVAEGRFAALVARAREAV